MVAPGTRRPGQRSHPAQVRSVLVVRATALWLQAKKCHNPVTGLPTPLCILCGLTRGNRQPCHPVGDRRMATARLAGQKTDGRGSQAVALRASATGAAGPTLDA